MEEFIITQAISVILFLLRDREKAVKWLPAIRKIRDAATVVAGTD